MNLSSTVMPSKAIRMLWAFIGVLLKLLSALGFPPKDTDTGFWMALTLLWALWLCSRIKQCLSRIRKFKWQKQRFNFQIERHLKRGTPKTYTGTCATQHLLIWRGQTGTETQQESLPVIKTGRKKKNLNEIPIPDS